MARIYKKQILLTSVGSMLTAIFIGLAQAEPITIEFSRSSESPVELKLQLNEEGIGSATARVMGCRVCPTQRYEVTSETEVMFDEEPVDIRELKLGDELIFINWETETKKLRKIDVRTRS